MLMYKTDNEETQAHARVVTGSTVPGKHWEAGLFDLDTREWIGEKESFATKEEAIARCDELVK